MARNKPLDIRIKIAIISGVFVVIAYSLSAYLGGPAFDTQLQERPVVAVSFSDYNHNYPKNTLQFDGKNFYVDILTKNLGKSIGKIVVIIDAKNASVSFFENEYFANSNQMRYFIQPLQNFTTLYPPVFIKPNSDIDSFSIELSVVDDPAKHPYQESGSFLPTKLVYKNVNGNFTLVNKK